MRTYKILGFLLCYPSEALQAAMPVCRDTLSEEPCLQGKTLKSVQKLTQYIEQANLLDLQEDYVSLFDRTPSLSLHLFEHIHGDSRDRGQALADLLRVYEEASLFIQNEEMPDFLPLFCEYVSTLEPALASETMGSVVNVLSILAERLTHRQSPYAAVCKALVDVASRRPSEKDVRKAIGISQGVEPTPRDLDAAWQEQFAFENNLQHGGQSSGCPKAEEMLARIQSQLLSEEPQKGVA